MKIKQTHLILFFFSPMLWGIIPFTPTFNFAVFFLMTTHTVFWCVMIGFLITDGERKTLK